MWEMIWAVIVITFCMALFFTISFVPFMLVLRVWPRKHVKSRLVVPTCLTLMLPVMLPMLMLISAWTAPSFEVLGQIHPILKILGWLGVMILGVLSLTSSYLVSGCICRQVNYARYRIHCFRHGVSVGDPPLW